MGFRQKKLSEMASVKKQSWGPISIINIVNDKFAEVHPVAFSNNGTALKPSIQFDEDRNVNAGFDNKYIDLNYCRITPFMKNKTLKTKSYMRPLFHPLQHLTTV